MLYQWVVTEETGSKNNYFCYILNIFLLKGGIHANFKKALLFYVIHWNSLFGVSKLNDGWPDPKQTTLTISKMHIEPDMIL